MTIKEYIKETIDNHQRKFGIYFDLDIRDGIDNSINNGIYAFQVIYNEKYECIEIINLDYNLCTHESKLGVIGSMWSYDGGQRYQWTEWETLVFDPSVIRDIKLKEVLK